ncbi:MAG: hypothetical protein GX790_08735 [Syntrophomonadaceae bacterium]|nr:hypothetical protein [Syntrophomonadaceae bacterium]
MRLARLLLFPLISLVLLIYISLSNWTLLHEPDNLTKLYLNNLAQGNFGFGLAANYNNGISFLGIEPGDIIVGGFPQCAYGRFSHAGLYIGDKLVLESYGDLGVTIQPIDHYWEYSEIAILRVDTTPEIKEQVISYVKNHEGGLFYPVAFKPGERIWNCTKIIWKAYLEYGIDLDANEDLWISPDAFYDSPLTTVIREKGR